MTTVKIARWESNFTEREQREIEFAQVYANQFNHGTDGHNAKLIVARFADMMGQVEMLLEDADPKANPAVERILHAFHSLTTKE